LHEILLFEEIIRVLMSPQLVQQALNNALATIKQNMATFGDRYPDDTTVENVYRLRPARNGFGEGDNYSWTTSFWPGVLWLAYELTGEEPYRTVAEQHIENFIRRIDGTIDLDTHDIGFLYTLSCVAPSRLTGNARAKEAAIKAAKQLMTRYLDKIGVFQAWGKLENPALRGNTIIDSLMNMPLLYWASAVTGDSSFAEAAQRHATTVRNNIIRPNDSTFHTFYWDVETGLPLRGSTAQGYADDSCWARGQAWAIYGFALNYRYTSDASFLEAAQCCADYFLRHLPADHVPYWDLVFSDGSNEERDSSAAAIAMCGLYELLNHISDEGQRQRYQTAIEAMLNSLITNYAAPEGAGSNALLWHGVYDKPKSVGVDEGNLWGDYFYMEALTRVLKPTWQSYW
jgi:unsaturated chondroitin disaccharide hydrolase